MADAESEAGGIAVFCLSIYLCLKILAQSAITLLNPRRIRLRTLLSNLIRDESGVTAIEYALIAALIAVAAIAAFTLVGTNLSTTFSTIAAKL
jgi:pilus assembly protein Flp/PilA